MEPLTRRDLLRTGLAAGVGLSVAPSLLRAEAASPNHLDAAVKAARWLKTARVATPQGFLWLTGPEKPEGFDSAPNLYSGSAGVVLFLNELAQVTGEASYKDEAVAGAYYLAALLPKEPGQESCGLYTGLAGQAFVLDRVAAATGEAPLRQAAERCRELIRADAKPAGAGVEWSPVTDVIAGSAGTGLYLLHHARATGDTAARDLAARAGQRLIELALPEAGGSKWRVDPDWPRLMPNFSHGTAGVAYFLATLFRDTGRRELLDSALAGGRYLQAIATTTGDSCLIFHNEPEGKDLYYLGWCHGPAGTARLFYQLHRATDDRLWLDWAQRSAQGVMRSGIPEQRTPGFWNNAGMCCGTASVADFFLHLHTVTGDERYLAFARRMVADLLAHATATPEGGLKWIHAEHRVRPEYTYAQTGYMQGAAGIGTLLLHAAAKEAGKPWALRLPDMPY